MRIAALEVHSVNVSPKTNWTFVAAHADDGTVGWGECSLNGWEPMLIAAVDRLRPAIVGSDLEAALAATQLVAHTPGGAVMHAAQSAAGQALIDVRARRERRPLHSLLSDVARARIPAYANINRGIAERSPEGFASAAVRACAAGYDRIKIAPFDGVVSQDAHTTPIAARIDAGIERVRAVRAAIGADRALMVDCHWRFDEVRAARLIDALAPSRPYWIECPITEHVSAFPALVRLHARANAAGIGLAGGEQIRMPEEAQAMCAARIYDVLMPDIKYAGGYRGMMAIADLCREHGVAFSPHNPTGPVAHVASIHLCAAATEVLWLEHQWAESPLFDALAGGALPPLVDGGFAVPSAPGLGVVVDRALAASRPWQPLPRDANLDPRLG